MSATLTKKIQVAADEMIQRYGKRANIVAGQWANSAYDRGENADYEFWQWVCMDIQQRDFPRRSPISVH